MSASPAESVRFLSLDEVLEIHTRLIDRFGGTLGIRDQGLISGGTADFDHLLPWIRQHLTRLPE